MRPWTAIRSVWRVAASCIVRTACYAGFVTGLKPAFATTMTRNTRAIGVEDQMKFALVAGERREAQPGLSGICEGCTAAMIAKCGTLKVWHWAHRSAVVCDHWWESETAWHRGWKNLFPESWQEFVHRADD